MADRPFVVTNRLFVVADPPFVVADPPFVVAYPPFGVADRLFGVADRLVFGVFDNKQETEAGVGHTQGVTITSEKLPTWFKNEVPVVESSLGVENALLGKPGRK